jgi:hypothetical protein
MVPFFDGPWIVTESGTPAGTPDDKAKIMGCPIADNSLFFAFNYGAPGEIRTPDRLVRSAPSESLHLVVIIHLYATSTAQ